jgi:hypothetical protein
MPQIINNSYNTTNNNLTINNNNTTINIINFGDTKFDHLDMVKLKERLVDLKTPDEITEEIIKQIHFNPKYPEYHNVRSTNLQPDYKYIEIFKNGWVKEMQIIVLNKLNSDTYNLTKNLILKEDYKKLCCELVEGEYDKLNCYEKFHHNCITNTCDFIKKGRHKAKMVVYNETKKMENDTSIQDTNKLDIDPFSDPFVNNDNVVSCM